MSSVTLKFHFFNTTHRVIRYLFQYNNLFLQVGFTYHLFNATISAMSRKTQYFVINNVATGRSLTVYGRNTVAKFLRENGCKFDDKKLLSIEGEKAVVFKNRNGNSFIVEEAVDAD